jgi:hypothetical protein
MASALFPIGRTRAVEEFRTLAGLRAWLTAAPPAKTEFAADSALEQRRFELSVPPLNASGSEGRRVAPFLFVAVAETPAQWFTDRTVLKGMDGASYYRERADHHSCW